MQRKREKEVMMTSRFDFQGNDLEYQYVKGETLLILRYIYVCVYCLVISRRKHQSSFKPRNGVIVIRN